MGDLVSVITACFNSEGLISGTLESILAQTYRPLELVVVDGASKDNTLAIINSFEGKYKMAGIGLIILSEPDRGIQDAYNKAIHLSNGVWAIFINSGDYFHDGDVLTQLVPGSIPNIPEVVYGDIELYFHKKKKFVIKYYQNQISLTFLKRNTICHQAVLFQRALFEKFGEYDTKYKIASDFDRILVFFLAGARFVHIPVIVSRFVDDGVSSLKFGRSILERVSILERRLGKHPDWSVRIPHYLEIMILFVRRQIFGFIRWPKWKG